MSLWTLYNVYVFLSPKSSCFHCSFRSSRLFLSPITTCLFFVTGRCIRFFVAKIVLFFCLFKSSRLNLSPYYMFFFTIGDIFVIVIYDIMFVFVSNDAMVVIVSNDVYYFFNLWRHVFCHQWRHVCFCYQWSHDVCIAET